MKIAAQDLFFADLLQLEEQKEYNEKGSEAETLMSPRNLSFLIAGGIILFSLVASAAILFLPLDKIPLLSSLLQPEEAANKQYEGLQPEGEDGDWFKFQGEVTSIENGTITILLQKGEITVEVDAADPEKYKVYEVTFEKGDTDADVIEKTAEDLQIGMIVGYNYPKRSNQFKHIISIQRVIGGEALSIGEIERIAGKPSVSQLSTDAIQMVIGDDNAGFFLVEIGKGDEIRVYKDRTSEHIEQVIQIERDEDLANAFGVLNSIPIEWVESSPGSGLVLVYKGN